MLWSRNFTLLPRKENWKNTLFEIHKLHENPLHCFGSVLIFVFCPVFNLSRCTRVNSLKTRSQVVVHTEKKQNHERTTSKPQSAPHKTRIKGRNACSTLWIKKREFYKRMRKKQTTSSLKRCSLNVMLCNVFAMHGGVLLALSPDFNAKTTT